MVLGWSFKDTVLISKLTSRGLSKH